MSDFPPAGPGAILGGQLIDIARADESHSGGWLGKSLVDPIGNVSAVDEVAIAWGGFDLGREIGRALAQIIGLRG